MRCALCLPRKDAQKKPRVWGVGRHRLCGVERWQRRRASSVRPRWNRRRRGKGTGAKILPCTKNSAPATTNESRRRAIVGSEGRNQTSSHRPEDGRNWKRRWVELNGQVRDDDGTPLGPALTYFEGRPQRRCGAILLEGCDVAVPESGAASAAAPLRRVLDARRGTTETTRPARERGAVPPQARGRAAHAAALLL